MSTLKSLLIIFNIFITTHSDLPTVDTYPKIVYKSEQEIYWMYQECDEENKWVDKKCTKKEGDVGAAGLYDHETETIYLNKTYLDKKSTIVQNSIILHELVHHIQYEAGILKDERICYGNKEMEAYRLQKLYLEQNGKDFFKEMEMNELFLLSILSVCDVWYY